MDRLRRKAKKNVHTNDYMIRKWWVEKYKRPTNDRLFMTRSWAEWQIEMFEDMYSERERIADRFRDGDIDSKVAMPALAALNNVLDDSVSIDPLADKWERELAEGKLPNLDEVM
jgi:hypothetical protein